MEVSRKALEKRAVKAGVKASKKRHHAISLGELLDLRVQMLPATLRVGMFVSGLLSIIAAVIAWPSDANWIQGIEGAGGIILMLFGVFGVRRTLAQALESVDAMDLAGSILEAVISAVSEIDLS